MLPLGNDSVILLCLENKTCYKFLLLSGNIPLQVSVMLLSIKVSPFLRSLSCMPSPSHHQWSLRKHRAGGLLHTRAKIGALSAI